MRLSSSRVGGDGVASAKYAWGEKRSKWGGKSSGKSIGKLNWIFTLLLRWSVFPSSRKFLIRLQLLDKVGNWVKLKGDFKRLLCGNLTLSLSFSLPPSPFLSFSPSLSLYVCALSACQIPSRVCALHKNRKLKTLCTAIRLTAKLVGLVYCQKRKRGERVEISWNLSCNYFAKAKQLIAVVVVPF